MKKNGLYIINPDWRFKRAVKEAGTTLPGLAELTGIGKHFLSLYGNGRYVFDIIERQKIADIIGRPQEEIFERNDIFKPR